MLYVLFLVVSFFNGYLLGRSQYRKIIYNIGFDDGYKSRDREIWKEESERLN